MKTIEQLKFFSPNDVSYNLTKSDKVSAAFADVGVADEKSEGGGGGQKIGFRLNTLLHN